jgi:septum formation protein
MRRLSDTFITDYLDAEGEAVLGCVGCYRIEGLGAQLFARVDGDQFSIRGLPLLAVLDYLRTRQLLPS